MVGAKVHAEYPQICMKLIMFVLNVLCFLLLGLGQVDPVLKVEMSSGEVAHLDLTNIILLKINC